MSSEKSFDLEERTLQFSQDTIRFCKSIELTTITKPLISQLIRSATSIGANYCEANNASSKKDFRNKIFFCKKEAQETKYWLKLLKTSLPEKVRELKILFQECHELNLIFQKIISTMKKEN